MPRLENGWSWIRFQAKDEEKRILDQYCQQTGRTKTDILREYVRSLATQLPPGWHESEFNGKIEGAYLGRTVVLYPNADGYDIWFEGQAISFSVSGVSAHEAIEKAKWAVEADVATAASAERLPPWCQSQTYPDGTQVFSGRYNGFRFILSSMKKSGYRLDIFSDATSVHQTSIINGTDPLIAIAAVQNLIDQQGEQ